MIDFTVYEDSTGEIVRIGSCPNENIADQLLVGQSVVEGHYSADAYYFINGIATAKATIPDDDSEWDVLSKEWIFNEPNAKQKLTRKVEREREHKDKSDIIYDGKNLQADDEARANIHGKIAEIVAAEAISTTISPLIWRCSDNIIHTWEDMLVYKAWLQGLVMAIAARSTSLYQASWTHKAAIAALDTVQEIKDYDINTGW
jgi:hypothetical protein